ncbi:Progestin and adipoQ receptor member [Mactra antiquata]
MFMVGSTGLGGPLYHKDQVPAHFHERYIVKGYRNPKSSPFQCLLSVFDATNETLNFWTHFLPSWYFMWIWRSLSETLDFKHDSYTWPLLGYMCMCCIYPLASSVAHTFNTMSDNARHICFFLDYSAISASAFATALAYRAYSFPSDLRHGKTGDVYLALALVNSCFCIIVSCYSRFMKVSSFQKMMRISSLGIPCLFTTVPLAYRLVLGSGQDADLTSSYCHSLSLIFMLLSGFVYGTHLPERLLPGTFDIVGHSHQLFHVFVIFGTLTQMQGILYDMKERRDLLFPDWEFTEVPSSIGLLGLVLIINTILVIMFSVYLFSLSKSKKL